MRVQTLQRGKIGQFLARQSVHRPGRGTGGILISIRAPGHTRIDDDHPLRPAHLESDVHAGGAAVDESGAVGHASVPEVADQHRSDSVVTPQQVAAADDQDRAAGRFEVERRFLRGHTIPLTTNFDSSRPVLPS